MQEGGWIKLYRSIRKHWLWEDAEKLKWWLDILLQANHQERKVLLGNGIIIVERGSFHTSIMKLSDRWKVDRKTVKKFLELLEKDNMISIKTSKKGTTLKVNNYGGYQAISEGESPNKVDNGMDNTMDNSMDNSMDKGMDNSVPIKSQQSGHKQELKNYKNDEEGKEGEEKEGPVLPPLSIQTNTHKVFLNRFGETSYRTWMMNNEVLEEDTVIKIFVEQDFYKTALEKYTATLEILTKKKIEVEVKPCILNKY